MGEVAMFNLDVDTNRVIEILEGAARTDRDPDTELARILPTVKSTDSDSVKRALTELLRDENTD